jgi:hypothetical protein
MSGAAVVCNAVLANSSNLSGWNVSLEKKYLRYFGVIADLGGQYGGASERNFLLGIRGGASIGRLRPFAEALFGAVQSHENGVADPKSDTSFAEALGVGVELRLVRMLAWRTQADEIKTGSPAFERRNLRVLTGVAVRFKLCAMRTSKISLPNKPH